jgi:hypothetical protein
MRVEREMFKGLYWRQNGSLRNYATQRVKRFGLGLKLREIDLANLTTGEAP